MTDRPILRFWLTEIDDPEERLEEAALWKALHDEWGDEIEAVSPRDTPPDSGFLFGRGKRFAGRLAQNPIPSHLPYWTDPAFLAATRRSFVTVPYDQVEGEVAKLHAAGKGAFIKSTVQKQAIFRVPVGEGVTEVIGEMAYSFIDGGPELMVQELVQIEFEYRFFCIGREIVTSSPVQVGLTPIDHPLSDGAIFRTPASESMVRNEQACERLRSIAQRVARKMAVPHAIIDCGMINGRPGVIELNPIQLGQFGLFACDVRALARASRELVSAGDSLPPVCVGRA